MPRVCLQFTNVVFPDHTHLLFFNVNIQLMCNKNDHFSTRFSYVRCLMPSLACTTLSPLDPRRPFHMLCISVATGYFGSRGMKHLKTNLKAQLSLFQ